MNNLLNIFMVMGLVCGMQSMAFADSMHNEARGQLLYTTHCNACHTAQIHWREQKLASDWNSLVDQVRRWQYITGQSWSDDEIRDVANYLDKLYYGFNSTAQNKKPAQQLMHKY